MYRHPEDRRAWKSAIRHHCSTCRLYGLPHDTTERELCFSYDKTAKMAQANQISTSTAAPPLNRTGSDGSDDPSENVTLPATDGDDKPSVPDKTISCVSCRKRKLKCDRVKPKCGTCTRLRHDCEFPERKRNLGSKRRNMKELEARLAQVEGKLVAETTKNNLSQQLPTASTTEPNWNSFPTDIDMNIDFGDEPLMDFDGGKADFTFQPHMPTEPMFSNEIISLGLQEPLPPQDMIDELHEIYFAIFHTTVPMIHRSRYMTALTLPTNLQPPVCLRYAMWAHASSMSDKYAHYADVLYERARRYLDQAEMKGHGETFVTIQHAQAWSLVATFEAKRTLFTRAWMSTGRCVRLCHMLGLHRIDGNSTDVKRILPQTTDAITLEERRRTFWGAFYGDRWASSGTGWPMIIDESQILVNLPCSEEAFESGTLEPSTTLQEALTPQGAAKITPFGGVVLSACLFGHNFQHLHATGPNERPNDLTNGEFWKRHRKMDNILSNTFMFLPDHLRLPSGIRDMNVVFLHMNIHASTICLHQAAVLTGEKHNVSHGHVRNCRARSLMAAEEIANIMRLISHFDPSFMNSWMGFTLYVAAGVFIQDHRSKDRSAQSADNLNFMLAALKMMGTRHSISQHFTAQLELDIESSGIRGVINGPTRDDKTPRPILSGVMPQSGAFAADGTSLSPCLSFDEVLSGILPGRQRKTNSADPNRFDSHAYGILAKSPAPTTSKSVRHPVIFGGQVPSWLPDAKSPSNSLGQSRVHSISSNSPSSNSGTPGSSSGTGNNTGPMDTDPDVVEHLLNNGPWMAVKAGQGTTADGENTTQYPYRHVDPSNFGAKKYSMFQDSTIVELGDASPNIPISNTFGPVETSNEWTFDVSFPDGSAFPQEQMGNQNGNFSNGTGDWNSSMPHG